MHIGLVATCNIKDGTATERGLYPALVSSYIQSQLDEEKVGCSRCQLHGDDTREGQTRASSDVQQTEREGPLVGCG